MGSGCHTEEGHMSRHIKCLAPVLLSTIFAAPAFAYTLQGRVLDQATLAPIPHADIYVYVIDPDSVQVPGASDDAGDYVLSGLPPANSIYVVTCLKSGYRSFYARVDQLAGGDVTYDILLGLPDPEPPPGPPPDSGSVSGQVLAPDGAGALHPVAGAKLTLQSGGGSAVVFTDAQGAYRTWVGIGTWSVAVTAGGYDAVHEPALQVVTGGVSFNAVLHANGTAGVPEAGARVWLGTVAPHPVRAAATLHYTLAVSGHVDPALFDAAGRRAVTLVDAWQAAGPHAVALSARGLPSGTY